MVIISVFIWKTRNSMSWVGVKMDLSGCIKKTKSSKQVMIVVKLCSHSPVECHLYILLRTTLAPLTNQNKYPFRIALDWSGLTLTKSLREFRYSLDIETE